MKRFNKLLPVVFILLFFPTHAQEEALLKEISETKEERGPTLNVGADFMSRYIWRGRDFGNSPVIQPNLYFSWQGFNIGSWGSYALSAYKIELNDTTVQEMGHYGEIDMYLSYTYKWFTLMLFDYFTVNGLNPNTGADYFDFNNQTTGHTLEALFIFEGPEKFPLDFIASVLVYGDDKNRDSTGQYGFGDKNNFSSYFELSYLFCIERAGIEFKPFIGVTPAGGAWYGSKAGIINAGLLVKKEISVTDRFAIPVQGSLVFNPQSRSAFLVFGFSL